MLKRILIILSIIIVSITSFSLIKKYNNKKNKSIKSTQEIEVKAELDPRLIIIHCYGKVGSISLENTLKTERPNFEVYRTHTLNIDRFYERRDLEPTEELKKISPMLYKNFTNQLAFAKTTNAAIQDGLKKNREIYFFIGIREPISNWISRVFHINSEIPNFYEKISTADLEKKLKEEFETDGYNEYQRWWEIEFFDYHHLTMDDLKNKTVKKGNLWLLDQNNVHYVFYRLEDLPQALNEAILVLDPEWNGVVKKDNIAQDKFYKEQYSKINHQIKFKKDTVDNVLSYPIVKFFYTEEERHKTREKYAAAK